MSDCFYDLPAITYDETTRRINIGNYIISIRTAEKHEERIYWKNFPH